MNSEAVALFLAGLAGGFGHCIGMCGPIVASYSLGDGRQGVLHHLLYNLGRVVTYTILGAVVGLTGSFLGLASSIGAAQKGVMALAGLAIVLMGMATADWSPLRKKGSGCSPLMPAISKAMALFRGSRSIGAHFPMGIVLGFLPCGLTYTALLAAARSSMEAHDHFAGMVQGGLMMLLFGIGTTPSLMLVGSLAGRIGQKSRARYYRIASLIMIGTGIWFIYGAFRP
ncbi:MAG: sulfite exporter TauE/SafE family protein [Chlorobiaceae bacterium]|nr:sulfite exporter TauE/SafE family protein [Chlorobiaceae bacterium]